jgi:hypothetical protein
MAGEPGELAHPAGGFYSLFFNPYETFFGFPGFHSQANTQPASHPPSG